MRSARLAAAVLLVLVPRLVRACPSCAVGDTGSREEQLRQLVMLGSMIALPFVVAGVVFLVLARAMRKEKPE